MKIVRISHCSGCGAMEFLMTEETETIISNCTCESRKLKCERCSHRFLRSGLSFSNKYLSLCKTCNGEKERLDYWFQTTPLSTARNNEIMLCVEVMGDRQQLVIRSFSMGLILIFPPMSKMEIVERWFKETYQPQEVGNLFNTAVLRLIPDYLNRKEMLLLKQKIIQSNQ